MSDRRVGSQDKRMADWMKRVDDRLTRLENGGAIAGHLSLHKSFDMGSDLGGELFGGVQFEVEVAEGSGRRVTITNMLTNSQHVIELP